MLSKISFSKIDKIEIYVNNGRKTMAQIKSLTGCDYIINGGIFNADWTPCPILKKDWKLVSDNPWRRVGYGWDSPNNFTYTSQYENYKDFICCIELFDSNGKILSPLSYPSAMGGARPRSAIGVTNSNELFLYCTTTNTTPERLRNIMASNDCKSGVMLDGGGSSQGNFNGTKVYASRIVHNFILVYLKKDKVNNPFPEPSVALRYGNRGIYVKWLQFQLNAHGYGCDVDGSFGPATKKVVLAFQKNKSLAVDGSVGPATKAKLKEI